MSYVGEGEETIDKVTYPFCRWLPNIHLIFDTKRYDTTAKYSVVERKGSRPCARNGYPRNKSAWKSTSNLKLALTQALWEVKSNRRHYRFLDDWVGNYETELKYISRSRPGCCIYEIEQQHQAFSIKTSWLTIDWRVVYGQPCTTRKKG